MIITDIGSGFLFVLKVCSKLQTRLLQKSFLNQNFLKEITSDKNYYFSR